MNILILFFLSICQIHGSWSMSTFEINILERKTKSFCGLIMHIENPETYQMLTATAGGKDRVKLTPVELQNYNSTWKSQKWEVNGQGSCYKSFSFRPLLHCHNDFSLKHEISRYHESEFVIQSVQCWAFENLTKKGAKDTRYLILNRSNQSEDRICLTRFDDSIGTARCNSENVNQHWKVHENL